jgi:hypothetical protein
VFDHAPGSRGAQDYQALYDELKSGDFLRPDDDELPKSALAGQFGVFLAGTPHQLATLR